MNIWSNTVITQKGLALQSKLIAGNTLNITKVQIGAGYVTPGLLMQQTAVSDPKKTLDMVSSISYPEEGKCSIKIEINNDDVTTGYTAKQVGFYANDPDEGEILYFIAQAENGTGTEVPSNTEMPGYSAEWTFYFQYGQADNVTVTVDPSNSVSRDEMETYVEEKTGGFVQKTGDTMTGPLEMHLDERYEWKKPLYLEKTTSDGTFSAYIDIEPYSNAVILSNGGDGQSGYGASLYLDDVWVMGATGDSVEYSSDYLAISARNIMVSSYGPFQAYVNDAPVSSIWFYDASDMMAVEDPPAKVDAHVVCLVGGRNGEYKTVYFIPYNNPNVPIYYRVYDTTTSMWAGDWKEKPVSLSESITLYVATTGSDSTGDGTSGKPFRTIAKALATLPKNLNGNTATINIASGTYSESRVDVTSFLNGELVITGSSSSTKPTISNGVYVNKCSAAVTLKWLNLTSSSSGSQGAAFVNSQQATIDTCAVTSATTQQNHGILIDSLSTAYIVGTHVTNCNYAILSRAARVFIQSASGGGNRIGFYSTNGGDIRIRESTVASTGALYFTEYGGRIYMGAQVSAPNY